jgi:hypothetical protein
MIDYSSFLTSEAVWYVWLPFLNSLLCVFCVSESACSTKQKTPRIEKHDQSVKGKNQTRKQSSKCFSKTLYPIVL